MRFGVLAAALLGFAIAVWLILRVGIGPVLDAILSTGWLGFGALCVLSLGNAALMGLAWWALVPGARATQLWPFVVARQMRDSAGDVLPFSQIGGVAVGARVAVLKGVAAPMAFASAIADVTTELMAQIVFIALGLALSFTALKGLDGGGTFANGLVVGLVLFIPGIAAFVVLQKRGTNLAEKLAARFLPAAMKHTSAFGGALRTLYDSPARLALSAFLHLVAWTVGAAWTWLAFRLIGANMDLRAAFAIEALLAALRSIMVFVPASIGVQEAGYAALAPLFGFSAADGLAVSLLKRARDIVVGVPVLLAWQAMEGRHALARPALVED